jgi:pseudouridylate synthase
MMPHVCIPLRIRDEVAHALAAGRPVVALESTLLAHGLPAGRNRDIADRLEATVRAQGAVPATIAVLDGAAVAGCDGDQLDRLCSGNVAKLSRRDLGPAAACGVAGATTVAGTLAVAGLAGIDVFATGGLGGVHRATDSRVSWDVSADLATLAAVPVLVVCSGVKSILDVAATLEQLETLSVPVIGFGTDAFPGFYRRDSGHPLPWRVDTVRAAALSFAAHRRLGAPAGLILANPVPPEHELATDLHDSALSSGLALVRQRGLRGKEVTPTLLAHFHTMTGGASVETNIALVLANAALAARVAVELSRLSPDDPAPPAASPGPATGNG